MWFQHLLPSISVEFSEKMILNSALDPVLHLVAESSKVEYDQTIYPYIKPIFKMAKSNQASFSMSKPGTECCNSLFELNSKHQATIALLENIEIFAEKSTEDDFKHEILPIVMNAFDAKNSDIQVIILLKYTFYCSHVCMFNVYITINDMFKKIPYLSSNFKSMTDCIRFFGCPTKLTFTLTFHNLKLKLFLTILQYVKINVISFELQSS